ncbi:MULTISPECIES: glycosyl hydrolase family 28-related protein [Burkholderia]|uniref:Pectate lyase-like protein n=1 Tax=Burkholderia pyrrocinia TaxID=60550 RepID=A0A318JAP1_BURPY|nr:MULTISPECIES: glycosyl hydrolase family 28-related protein [Burkholderia]PXX37652.1 pectate lyase-like protein [Burkholderia pyrrocinia]SFW35800.1 Pectate lyase superfamily protein [Burkholderia sp. NFACC33-1]SFX90707.1 Pectate lyase superfamily protein [Burkholderia sp. NFPP32]
MTVSSSTSRADYNGNGATTLFPVPFYFLDPTHIKVQRTDFSTTPPTTALLVLNSDYTVSGAGVQQGGSIITAIAPTAGQRITILRNVPFTQLTHYVPNDPFPAATHEQALDQLTMEVQQINEVATHALSFPTYETPQATVPPASIRASTMLGFDANGNATYLPVPSSVGAGDLRTDVFTAGVDFTSGVSASVTLSRAPGTVNNISIHFDASWQGPDQVSSLNGAVLTFTAPIPVGVQKVYVTSGTTVSLGAPSIGSVTDAMTAVGSGLYNRVHDYISAKDLGCVGDGVHDDTAAMQAAFNEANERGKELFIPAGTYRLTDAINIDNSGQSTFPQLRISVRGEGPQNSVLHWDNGPQGGLSIVGSITGIAATSMQTFRDFSVIKDDGQSIGMFFKSHAHLLLENIWILGWSTGIDYEDVQESIQTNVDAQYNVTGLHAARLNFSLPNALSFYNCTYGNNKQAGIDAINVNTFTYIGGSIESNNDLTGSTYNPVWGCRLLTDSNAVNEGTASGTFVGTYFERNGSATDGIGKADLWYANYATESTLVVKGCTFNRGTTFGTNQILIDTVGGRRHKVVLEGNGHSAPPMGGYPGASPSRPYVKVYNPADKVSVVDLANFYQSSIEAPNYAGAGGMPASVVCAESNLGGWVRFNGLTCEIAKSFGVLSVTKTGTGAYTVTLAQAQPSPGSRAYFGSVTGGFGLPQVPTESASQVNVVAVNAAGIPTDFAVVTLCWAADSAA